MEKIGKEFVFNIGGYMSTKKEYEKLRVEIKKRYKAEIEALEKENRILLSDNLALLRHIYKLESERKNLISKIESYTDTYDKHKVTNFDQLILGMYKHKNGIEEPSYDCRSLIRKLSYTLSKILEQERKWG